MKREQPRTMEELEMCYPPDVFDDAMWKLVEAQEKADAFETQNQALFDKVRLDNPEWPEHWVYTHILANVK